MFDKQPTIIQGDMLRISLNSSNITALHVLRMREALQLSHCDHDETFVLDEMIADILIEMHSLTDLIDQKVHFACPELQVRSFVSARLSVECRLLRMHGQVGLNNYSKAVCLAAQVYVNRVLRTFERGTSIPHRIAERLKRAIVSTLSSVPRGRELPAPMLWVAFMGGVGARDGPLRLWFMEFVHHIGYSACLRSWHDVLLLLRQWPWSEEFLTDECKMLWQNVVERGRPENFDVYTLCDEGGRCPDELREFPEN